MPRRPRRGTGGIAFHVFNRAIQSLQLFDDAGDYEQFLGIVTQAAERFEMRILAYATMPNHWHLVLWPRYDADLSAFMQSLTGTHAAQWRASRRNIGRGAVYQGRFKAVPVQSDCHLLRLCRYVERNPVRARLVGVAEEWPWSSASLRAADEGRPLIARWPVPKPADWSDWLNAPEPPSDLYEIRESMRRGLPYGTPEWCADTLALMGLTLRSGTFLRWGETMTDL